MYCSISGPFDKLGRRQTVSTFNISEKIVVVVLSCLFGTWFIGLFEWTILDWVTPVAIVP